MIRHMFTTCIAVYLTVRDVRAYKSRNASRRAERCEREHETTYRMKPPPLAASDRASGDEGWGGEAHDSGMVMLPMGHTPIKPAPSSSLTSGVLNLLNTIVGAGILSLPYAFKVREGYGPSCLTPRLNPSPRHARPRSPCRTRSR